MWTVVQEGRWRRAGLSGSPRILLERSLRSLVLRSDSGGVCDLWRNGRATRREKGDFGQILTSTSPSDVERLSLPGIAQYDWVSSSVFNSMAECELRFGTTQVLLQRLSKGLHARKVPTRPPPRKTKSDTANTVTKLISGVCTTCLGSFSMKALLVLDSIGIPLPWDGRPQPI